MGVECRKLAIRCINSSSHYQILICLKFKRLKLKADRDKNFNHPASDFQLFYFSSFSLISLAIGLSKTLNSSLGFS